MSMKWLIATTAVAAIVTIVSAQSPTVESDGWTPVTSSQVVNLPSRYQQQQRQQQQRQQLQPKQSPPENNPYLPEPTDDYKSQWDGFYGTDQNDVNAKQQQQVEEEKEIVQDEVDIRPPQQEKRNPVKNDVVPQLDVEEQDEKKTEVQVEAGETEKPPLIVYPAASIDETPLRDNDDNVQVQTPAQTVPDFLQPKRKQKPAIQRFPAPSRQPLPSRQPPLPLPKSSAAPPNPRFKPLVRGVPPRRQRPRPQQQALPRNSVVPPQDGRQAPRPARPYPPGPPRRRPPPQKSGGILASVGLDCLADKFTANIKLKDKVFMRNQINCMLNKGPCDDTGKTIKRIAPDVLRGGCPPPCDECKRQQIRKAMGVIQREYPREFNEIMRGFNTRNG